MYSIKAILNLKRASPVVNKMDRIELNKLDLLLKKFYEIPATNSALKRAKREAYFMHIYHSNAIEGNTLNLQQTRHIIENRMAINGKSLIEHQEVLGLHEAMKYINETLLYRQFGIVSIKEILAIHRRVLGFTDPIAAGSFRKHQVFVGHFTPPPPHLVESLMNEFIEWLNSNQLFKELHPVEIAALAHYKFVYIHPFYDGNGRTSRILMNLILMKTGYPPVIIKKEERLNYYEYLEMANQGD
jgi:Fic family protein